MPTSRGTGEPLADLDAILVEAEQVPKVRQIERQATRRTKVAIIAFAIFCLFVTAWSAWNTDKIADTRAQQVVNQQAIDDLREVNRLRAEQGLSQIPLPKPGDPVDASAVAEAAAAIALDQVKNDPRFKGPQGQRGAPCVPQVPGCTGPMGPGGQNGSQGQEGPSGPSGTPGEPGPGPSDDQVLAGVSAYCTAHPVNCMGPQGDPGEPGAQGPPGPAPTSLKFNFLGVPYTCTDPDGDTNYECSPMGE
jgi:hypothetical protein